MGRWSSIAILAAVLAFDPAPSTVVAQNKGPGPFPVKVRNNNMIQQHCQKTLAWLGGH